MPPSPGGRRRRADACSRPGEVRHSAGGAGRRHIRRRFGRGARARRRVRHLPFRSQRTRRHPGPAPAAHPGSRGLRRRRASRCRCAQRATRRPCCGQRIGLLWGLHLVPARPDPALRRQGRRPGWRPASPVASRERDPRVRRARRLRDAHAGVRAGHRTAARRDAAGQGGPARVCSPHRGRGGAQPRAGRRGRNRRGDRLRGSGAQCRPGRPARRRVASHRRRPQPGQAGARPPVRRDRRRRRLAGRTRSTPCSP